MWLTWETVTWSDVCYYCCGLDYEISIFSWKGIEILTFSWVTLILISVYWTLTSCSLVYGSEMYFVRCWIWNEIVGGGSGNEVAFCMKTLRKCKSTAEGHILTNLTKVTSHWQDGCSTTWTIQFSHKVLCYSMWPSKVLMVHVLQLLWLNDLCYMRWD